MLCGSVSMGFQGSSRCFRESLTGLHTWKTIFLDLLRQIQVLPNHPNGSHASCYLLPAPQECVEGSTLKNRSDGSKIVQDLHGMQNVVLLFEQDAKLRTAGEVLPYRSKT